ncbi:MAG: UMP kinase [Spirochaetaceae bacterium]|jgi:uridylate kinase|nr:UMP kinase [Spirochaetaceae bacterium]
MLHVISLGGSVVAPDGADEQFIRDFVLMIESLLKEDAERRFIFVVGGGGPARVWQRVYRNICGDRAEAQQADWIGIMATRLNAQLIKAVFGDFCVQDLVTDPTQVSAFVGRVMVAAGWKPGFSSDNDAVLLAERFGADTVINLSNIEQVYTDDPDKNPDATPVNLISWADFCALVGESWVPGKHVPFDPVASRRAAERGLTVICTAGRNLDNLKQLLEGKSFIGTIIKN